MYASATLVIGGDVGSRASQSKYRGAEAKEECRHILEHFNVELDNPITILQQEEAKVFFKELSEETLYNFFERATLLRSMQENYKEAKANIQSLEGDLKRNEKKLADMVRHAVTVRFLFSYVESLFFPET